MKTFKASHLVKKPAEVFAEARLNGAIIQRMNTNGDVLEEFVIVKIPASKESLDNAVRSIEKLMFFRGVARDQEESLLKSVFGEVNNA